MHTSRRTSVEIQWPSMSQVTLRLTENASRWRHLAKKCDGAFDLAQASEGGAILRLQFQLTSAALRDGVLRSC